jgi:SAM-dependent methyltransferase
MLTMDSTLRELMQLVPSYQPISLEGFYKPGWWINLPEDEQLNYVRERGLGAIDLHGKSFMDVGCAEGYVCFYAEQQGAEYVIACDGWSWKYGTNAEYPWETVHPQNALILFEVLKLLKHSKVIRLVEDVESADFVDSVHRLGRSHIDIVLCAGVLYHAVNPVKALRNVFSVTGEMAVFNIPDFRQLQADGRAFTPYDNRPEQNDFNYSRVLQYGATNNRLWNLSPDDWKSMMQHVGFADIETETAGTCTVYRCRVPGCTPAHEVSRVQGPYPATDASMSRPPFAAAREPGRFGRVMRAVHELWRGM